MQYIISFGRADGRDAALLEAAFVLLQEVATQLRAQVFVARVHIHVQAVQLHEHPSILLLEHTSSPQACGRLISYKVSGFNIVKINFICRKYIIKFISS